MTVESFTAVFTQALLGHPCSVVGLDPEPRPLPVADWTRNADAHDHDMLALCEGATLDIGCGPGRLTAALAERGHIVLGIDVVHEAVGQTRERGVAAVRRDVFDKLPGEGTWETALLADGNLGIGGDPVALLRRVRELLDPRGGRVVAEVAPPGVPLKASWASLECGEASSRPFRWAVVGVDDIGRVSAEAGFALSGLHRHGDRWTALLEEPR